MEIKENSPSVARKGLKDSDFINYSPGKASRNNLKNSILKGSIASNKSIGLDSKYFLK